MIRKFNNKKGFSLIEIILAISIFALSIMGLTGGLIYGQQSNLIASHREQAVFLAKEGIEAGENIGRENFTNLVDGSFGLVVENNSYAFGGSSDIWDIYNRQITISSIDANTKQVSSRVSWSLSIMDEGQIIYNTYITNWK